MMNTSEIYLVWADPASPWSAWVKPVLFAFMNPVPAISLPQDRAIGLDWLPRNERHVAVIVDLDGAEGVRMGIALARHGYRPIPLYNALPYPPPGDENARTAVDVVGIAAALYAATATLQSLSVRDDAPPAFLLDAQRRTAGFRLEVGDFDNRSVCFPTDFPSGKLLRESGIDRVLVIERHHKPDADLVAVLLEWQREGIAILRKDLHVEGRAAVLDVRRPRWWKRLWYRVAITLGLRRSALGGFGGIIHSSGG